MSDANAVFPVRGDDHGPQSERRFIQTSRRTPGGPSRQRVVEVVHVHRDRGNPARQQSRQHAGPVRVAIWEDGFKAKPAAPALFAEPSPAKQEPAQPVTHVLRQWQPAPPPAVERAGDAEAKAVEPVGGGPARRGRPRKAKPETPERSFVDPYADEAGANCMRCGYLVEAARERRGLLTCANCG